MAVYIRAIVWASVSLGMSWEGTGWDGSYLRPPRSYHGGMKVEWHLDLS